MKKYQELAHKIFKFIDSQKDYTETDVIWAAHDVLFCILYMIGFNKEQALECIKNHADERYRKQPNEKRTD